MRAIWYEQKGPARDVLQLGEIPRPDPQPGEVLVRVRTSGINPSDTKGRGGARGNLSMPFPRIIPHQDGAGIIEAVGEGVDASRVGERVWFYEAQLGRPFGSAADYVAVPTEKAVALPTNTSFEEGACLGVPALTAHRCVQADGSLEERTVLVTGGAGAVGFYAIQFAKRAGARVVTTVSTEAQADVARSAGADLVANRRNEDLVAVLGERSVDRIVEVAFGANLQDSLRLLRPNGVIAAFSSDAESEPRLPFWPLVMLDATVRFVLVYAMSREAHQDAADAVCSGLRDGWLRHNIAERMPLEAAAEAHELVESGRANGKVVLVI